MTRFAVALAATAGGLLAATAARAQDAGVTPVSCASLPNPIYAGGSSAFAPTIEAIAAKLAQATTPVTVVYQSSASCTGATDIATTAALTGTNGIYFKADGTMGMCSFDTHPTLDVGVSDVFYESCGTLAPARPANLKDVPGPVQAMEVIVPKNNTLGYLTAQEGQDIWGCSSVPSTITSVEPMGVFCRGASSGTQIIIGAAIGLDPSAFVGNSNTALAVSGGAMPGAVGGYPVAHTSPTIDYNAIGFLAADAFDNYSSTTAPIIAVPFQANGQTKAYYADSAPGTKDRRNVRNGHYFPWGYEHLFALADATSGQVGANAANLIGWINGTTAGASFDYVQVEGKAGTIPLCAMQVQKTNDVPGYLSPYTPAESCNCAYEAAYAGTAPAGCTPCTTGGDAGSTCTGGKTCSHGYCE